MLLEDLCAALGGKTPYYLFLDDFHLLGDERVAQFLCRLAYRLPENVHLIVASRNRVLPGEQVVRRGRRLHRIEADGLRLNREELLAYTHRCGVEITTAKIRRERLGHIELDAPVSHLWNINGIA